MSSRSWLVISALLTAFVVGATSVPVVAKNRTPGVRKDEDDEDDSGDEEIDSTTVQHGLPREVLPGVDADKDIDEMNVPPPKAKPPVPEPDWREHGHRSEHQEEDAR